MGVDVAGLCCYTRLYILVIYFIFLLLLFVRGYFILKEACAILLRVTVTVCTSADGIRR